MKYDFKNFAKCALIRAVKTIAQTALAIIGTSVVLSDVNWAMVLSASALAGLASLLTSVITGLPEVDMKNTSISMSAANTEMEGE